MTVSDVSIAKYRGNTRQEHIVIAEMNHCFYYMTRSTIIFANKNMITNIYNSLLFALPWEGKDLEEKSRRGMLAMLRFVDK